MKASIYARVSDESQVKEGVSLAAQISKGMALLGAQGWELCRIHQEEGVSGTKASRPELDALLVDVRRGAIGAIIVYDLDRAFRNLDLQRKVLADCRQLGVSIWSSLSRSEIKTDTAGDRLSLNIRGAVAEHYADFIGERTREALSYLRGQGYFAGGMVRPGFKVIPATDGTPHRMLIVDPEEGPKVAEAWSVINRGGSITDAARALNAAGVTTSRGGE